MDKACFELKGSLFTLTVLHIFDDNLSLLEAQLKERVKLAPGFFNHTPLVLDFHELSEEKQDLDFFDLREILLSLSIIPVGIIGASKAVHSHLEAAGMAVLAEAKTPRPKNNENVQEQTEAIQKPEPLETQKKAESQQKSKEVPQEVQEKKSVPAPKTKVVRQTIRSGRQVYAPGGDLVIIGSVSAGAEILADGNIHIYGTLRGRALAGVRGDQSASIFCHNLQAELISIAGIYLLSEDIPEDKINALVQIQLEDEKLQIESII